MSCFIGISIQQQLEQDVYNEALTQIQDFISQTNFGISPHENLFIIPNRYQRFCISKNSKYIHSQLQHFVVSDQIDEDYIETLVQSLMILKQYFPHKIHIEMVSELDQIFNLKMKMQQEIPRRLISHLKILQQQSTKENLKIRQVEMLIKNLVTEFHREYKQKIKSLSLKVLAEGKVDTKVWRSLSKEYIQIIDSLGNQPLHQKLAIQILERIIRSNDKTFSFSNEKQNENQNLMSTLRLGFINQSNNKQQKEPISEFDGPFNIATALFQLKQSMNLGRICWILSKAVNQALQQSKLKKFDKRVKQVGEKFLKGFYSQASIGIEQNFCKQFQNYENWRQGKINWKGLSSDIWEKIEKKRGGKGVEKINIRQEKGKVVNIKMSKQFPQSK